MIFLSMNYLKRLSSSTLKAVRNVGKLLNLQQILLVPINTQSEEVIQLFTKVDGENRKVNGRNRYFLNTLRKMFPFKKQGSTQLLINPKESPNEPFNPFITHILSDDSVAALIFDKGSDTSVDWTLEEMELLQLISQIVKADLLFESGNTITGQIDKLSGFKHVSYKILQLQYVLPIANSLRVLKITKKRFESLDYCVGLEEFMEIESYLNRSLKILNFAKEAVDGIQVNYWLQTTGENKAAVDKIVIEEFFSEFCDGYKCAEVEIYYGNVHPVSSTLGREIYIRTVILKNFLNAVFDNAVRFSREYNTEIYVTSELDDLDLIITVRDMGIGIPEDEIEYIAYPFFKASNNETNKGLGIELSIIKRMIEECGGAMKFYSVENEFTEVVCNLPYLVNDPQDKDRL